MNPLQPAASTYLDSSTVTFNGKTRLQFGSAVELQEA